MSRSRSARGLLHARALRRHLCIEHLLARLLELAEISGRRHAAGEFRARLRRATDLFHVLRRFLRCHCAEIRPSGVCGYLQCLCRHAHLGKFEAALLEFGAGRHGDQAEQVEQEGALDFDFVGAREPRKGEAGVAQPPGLDEIGLGDAELGIDRL